MPSPPTPPSATGCCSSAPASAPRRSSRCCRSSPRETDVEVILRASTPAELVLRDEVTGEVERRGGRLAEIVGSRDQVRLDAGALCELVPDVHRREVYLCGPHALSSRLTSELRQAGVPERQIHFESFTS